MKSTLIRRLAFLFTVVAAANAASARADILYVDQFRTLYSTQTGDGATLNQDGYVLSTRLFASAPNFYDSATMTGPGGSVSLTPEVSDPSVYIYSSGFFASTSDMDSSYPLGATYQYVASTTLGSDSTALTVQSTDYPQSMPYLAGTTYSSLQGMNASQDFHFEFSPFATGSTATFSFIFLTIYDQTLGTVAFNADFLDPSTTDLTLAGGTLQSGHQYTYELIFSNRDAVETEGTVYSSVLGFDYRTSGTFSTAAAVPEPSSAILTAVGGVVAFAFGRRRRIRGAA